MSETLEKNSSPDAQVAEDDVPGTPPPEPVPVSDAQGGSSQRLSSWRAFRDPLLVGVLVVAFVADQLTKQIVLDNLGLGASWPHDGFFRFTFVRNDGTAFGLFQDNGTLLTFVSIGAVALIVWFYREAAMASWFTRVALGLQLGGAAGNVIDRLRHGYVVDFIDVGAWPVFNIADSAIVTGIVALIAYFVFIDGRRGPSAFRPTSQTDQSGQPGPASPKAPTEPPE